MAGSSRAISVETERGTMAHVKSQKNTVSWGYIAAGWLVPGLGYYLLKERGKACLAFVSVFALFFIGLWHGGGGTGIDKSIPITHLIPLVSLGCGPVYLLVLIMEMGSSAAGNLFPIGQTLIWLAGGMNIVFIVDTYFRQKDQKFLLTCLLSWCLPGAGHISRRRYARGILFFVMILCMFFFGLALQGKLYTAEKDQPLTILATFADLGIGQLYYLILWSGNGSGNIEASTSELGNTFILVAGLLNMLVILDVFDLCTGRGLYMRLQPEKGEN